VSGSAYWVLENLSISVCHIDNRDFIMGRMEGKMNVRRAIVVLKEGRGSFGTHTCVRSRCIHTGLLQTMIYVKYNCDAATR
jgi:hypothetical protein